MFFAIKNIAGSTFLHNAEAPGLWKEVFTLIDVILTNIYSGIFYPRRCRRLQRCDWYHQEQAPFHSLDSPFPTWFAASRKG